MEEFKQEFINVAYSEFGIKSIESIDFKQAFAILDKMQQLRIHGVVNCKHENYTPYYGREGELMEKRCDDCGQEID